MIVAQPTPTRQRLIDEGMGLFAQAGFHATSVGDIEAAAGLQPRRGALYDGGDQPVIASTAPVVAPYRAPLPRPKTRCGDTPLAAP